MSGPGISSSSYRELLCSLDLFFFDTADYIGKSERLDTASLSFADSCDLMAMPISVYATSTSGTTSSRIPGSSFYSS